MPGKKAYKQGDMAGKLYADAIKLLDGAKATQDLSALANLTPIMAQFGELSFILNSLLVTKI